MKRIIFIVIVAAVLSGCSNGVELLRPNTPTQTPFRKGELSPEIKESLAPSMNTSAQPKISSDFSNAPDVDDVKALTSLEISDVLLQDATEYELPLDKYFAVVLQEDSSKNLRWLLASEDGIYKFIGENHLDGYRVFVFEPLNKGETNILFEFTENGKTLIETINYHLFLGTASGD